MPLCVHLAGGRSLDVHNPGLCFFPRPALYVFNARFRGVPAQDVQVFSLWNIVSVETSDNGRPRKRSRRAPDRWRGRGVEELDSFAVGVAPGQRGAYNAQNSLEAPSHETNDPGGR